MPPVINHTGITYLVQILLVTFSSVMLSPGHDLPLPSNSMDHIEHCCKCGINQCPSVLGIFTQNGQSSFNSNSFPIVKSCSVLHLRSISDTSDIPYSYSDSFLTSYLPSDPVIFLIFLSPLFCFCSSLLILFCLTLHVSM